MSEKKVIQNVVLYDGSGSKPFKADVLIAGEIIAKIGLPRTIHNYPIVDGTGLALAPGFIDTHSHSDLEAIRQPKLLHVISQGITTEVVGQDGSSVAPVTDLNVYDLAINMAPLAGVIDQPYWWRGVAEYKQAIAKANPATRIETLIGHGSVRMAVMGNGDRVPSTEELHAMTDLVAQGLAEGARGVSFGLIYPPGSYADTAELIEIARVVQQYDGVIMVHMRNEQDRIHESIDEMAQLLKATGVRLHISHLKALGYRNWGQAKNILERIDKLREAGYELTFDQYPYAATCTGLKVVVPMWAYAGGEVEFQKRLNDIDQYSKILGATASQIEARGGAEKIMIATVTHKEYAWMAGQSLAFIAEQLRMTAEQAALHILQYDGPAVVAIYFSISEDDLQTILQHPLHGICTDGIIGTNPHPRAYGAFPRVLGYYCRQLQLISLEEAIRRMTFEPARRLRLWDRGLIREGMSADLVLFNSETIKDCNSYFSPKEYSQGIEKVWVKGVLKYQRTEREINEFTS